MRTIINGKIYDTETAGTICYNGNGLGARDFRNLSETLYLTKKKQFFLHGEGGAMTEYARKAGNMMSGGSKIILLSDDEAKNFMEKHADIETYERFFPLDEG